MPLQDVETLGYAVITDICESAGDKTLHLLGAPAAERAGERRPEQTTDLAQRGAGSQVDQSALLIHDSSDQSIMAAGHAP
jgi:hypothetical protein